jgi:hypothetical protein
MRSGHQQATRDDTARTTGIWEKAAAGRRTRSGKEVLGTPHRQREGAAVRTRGRCAPADYDEAVSASAMDDGCATLSSAARAAVSSVSASVPSAGNLATPALTETA